MSTLSVVSMLLLVMLMVLAHGHRSLIAEQQTATHLYRSTQAHEAAEAGIEWALAMVNAGKVSAACLPSDGAGDLPFRTRFLEAATGGYQHRANPGGTPPWLQPGCIKDGANWTCACPNVGAADLLPPVDGSMAPLFVVDFTSPPAAEGTAGMVDVTSTGCADWESRPCGDVPSDDEATKSVRVRLALVPALATPPVSTVTAKGSVDLSASDISLHNNDMATLGLSINAGSSTSPGTGSVTSLPGSPATAAWVDHDADLASRSDEAIFRTLFGMPAASYKSLPTVKRVACGGDCTAAVVAAFHAGTRMVWVDGDVNLSATTLGTADEPVLLIVDGHITCTGDVRVVGLLFGRSLAWHGGTSETASSLQGAAVITGSVTGTGTAQWRYDSAVLAKLHRSTGAFARVPGSWKDF